MSSLSIDDQSRARRSRIAGRVFESDWEIEFACRCASGEKSGSSPCSIMACRAMAVRLSIRNAQRPNFSMSARADQKM